MKKYKIHIAAFPDIINHEPAYIPDSFYDKWHTAWKTVTGSWMIDKDYYSWYIPDYIIDKIEEE